VPAAQAQTPPSTPPWNVYTIKGEDVSVVLPELPSLQTFKEMRKSAQSKRNIMYCTVKGVSYTVQVLENSKPRLTLEAFIQEQTAPYREKLTFERDLTLDGIAGKAFRFNDGQGIVQFYANNSRLYVVRASGAPADDPRMATFFYYFSFKKQEGAIEVSQDVQAGTASDKAYVGKDVDHKVRLLSKPEPSYTGKAKLEQITGTVVLKCVFASDGTITNIRVVQGLPNGLTERAIAAARQIKFIPATKDGKNVSMWMQLEYNFNLY
jgi:TonB family protein